MSETAVPGARNLFYFKIGELGWSILNVLFWQVGMRMFGMGDSVLWIRIAGIVGALLTLVGFVLLIPFMQGRRGTPSESLAQGAVVLTGIILLFEVLGVLPGAERLFSRGSSVNTLRLLVAYGAEICLWLALARSTVTTLTPAFFGLLVGSAMFSLASMVLPFDTYRRLFFESGFSSALSWLRMGLSFATAGFFIVLLNQLVRSGGPAGVAAPTDGTKPAASAGREILSGAALLLIGLASTLISYSAASGGGRYFIASGAIAWGLVRLVRGLVRLTS